MEPRPGETWVAFDPDFWAEDLARVTPNGRTVAEVWRQHEARRGVLLVRSLHTCHPARKHSTPLADCAELPVPAPWGPWALIFAFAWDPGVERPILDFLAFGPRHGPAETAYQIATRRRLDEPTGSTPRSRAS